MIVTFLIWGIVFLICLSYGFFVIKLFDIINKTEEVCVDSSNIISVFLIGFILCYIIASILSLFIPLGWFAFILIIIPAIFILVKNSAIRSLFTALKSITNSYNPYIFLIVIISLLILSLWLTSGEIKNSDTYIYHAQSIHWIESYPVIKGLGNFFNRLAYNSGWFVQNALFSFSFLGYRSFHVLNGLLLFTISTFFILEFFQASKKHDVGIPQIFGLIIIPLGIISIGTQASAPSTDMPVAYLSWVAGYLSMQHSKDKNPYWSIFFISGIIAFAFTIKISIAPLFLIPVLLITTNIKSIRFKKLLPIMVWGSMILIPWMIRNVVISGYAIYPSAVTALPFEWRIPESIVLDDAFGIRAWGYFERASAEEVMSKPFSERIKLWFFNLTTNQKLMALVSLFTPIILTINYLISFIRKKISLPYSLLMTIASFFVGFLFWIFVSPNMRFGYVYILFLFSICFATGIYWLVSQFNFPLTLKVNLGVLGLALIVILLFARSFNMADLHTRFLLPQDYSRRSTHPCDIDGGKLTILCASEYGECGYYPFPCHAWGNETVRMYGEKLTDGFYMELTNSYP